MAGGDIAVPRSWELIRDRSTALLDFMGCRMSPMERRGGQNGWLWCWWGGSPFLLLEVFGMIPLNVVSCCV
jgi:hypothetical protein